MLTLQGNEARLTHIDGEGRVTMVDVGHKSESKRSATASATVCLGKRVYEMVVANAVAKGNVQEVARIAGILAAKQTSQLIPLCHNVPLSVVRPTFLLLVSPLSQAHNAYSQAVFTLAIRPASPHDVPATLGQGSFMLHELCS